MTGVAWWAWAAASLLAALGELHAPGAYLIWLALGGIVTAGLVAGFAIASLAAQIAVFAVCACAACALGWLVYRRRPGGGGTLNRRGAQLVGAHATVCDGFVNGQGKVRLGDGAWLAEGPSLREGAEVVVTEVRGSRLIVRAADG